MQMSVTKDYTFYYICSCQKMLAGTANNDYFGRVRTSVGESVELVFVNLLVRCLYWALMLIT